MARLSLLTLAGLMLVACDKPQITPDTPAPQAQSRPAASASPDRSDPPPADSGPTAAIGQPAPNFTLPDLNGTLHQLSNYRGQLVVLEWFNPECPFVKFAHTQGPLNDMANQQIAKKVVWLAINSGGPGRQGHGLNPNQKGVSAFGLSHPVLLDEQGVVGHQYGATKTPHIFLIGPDGTLLYKGAIDNAPFGEVDGDGPTIGYLEVALEQHRTNMPITTPQTPSYGCSVKYSD